MEYTELYLGLGSNQGDRKAFLDAAVRSIDAVLGMPATRISSCLETPSWGFEGADFLNLVLRYDLPPSGVDPSLHAHALLHAFQDIERALGRTRKSVNIDGKPCYSDRPIDIDILLYGRTRIQTETLVVPHPLMHLRDFVQIPLREILSPQMAAWLTPQA